MSGRRINFFIFDHLNRFSNSFSVSSSRLYDKELNEINTADGSFETVPNFDVEFNIDGYSLSVFHNNLLNSMNYRKLVKKNLLKALGNAQIGRDVDVRLQLVKPKAEVLDLVWNDRLSKILKEKQELEYSMSWLSTLGGAFSALGDDFEHCAKVAGRISVQQFQIALRLGEPPLIARCKLYMALSLIQQKKLKAAKKIIEDQYEVAKKFKDFRLINMCKGIWAKLQYTYKLEKSNKMVL